MKRLSIVAAALVAVAVVASLMLTASAEPEMIDTITFGEDIPYNVAVNPQTNLVYVTVRDVDAGAGVYYVAVIDSATNTVTATIPIDGTSYYTRGIAVNSDTNTVYVATDDPSAIAVIDGATNAVTAYITVGQNPWGLAVNPNTNTVYAADYEGKLWVISGAANTVTGSVSLDGRPAGVAVNPNTNTVYVTQVNKLPDSPEGLYVWVVDGATNSVTAKIPTGSDRIDLREVVVNPSTNTIYMTNPWHPVRGNVLVINGATNSVTSTIPVGADPYSVGLNAVANRLYVVNQDDDTLSFIDIPTNSVTGTIGVGDEPWGAAVVPSTSRLYLVNGVTEDLSVIEDDGLPGPNEPTPTPTPTPPPPTPTSTVETVGIDADPGGNTATSLGTIDRCIEVGSGETFDIDVFVDAIPEDRDLAGFNYLLNYDPSKLQVNACNHDMLLASEPGSDVVDVSDEVCRTGAPPDTDGTLLVGAADLAPAPEPGGSLGVLGRYQFEAVGSGTSVLILEPFVGGGIVADSSPAFIPVDEIHDGNWVPMHGIIAVGGDMDGDGAGDCEDPDIDGDGFLNFREEDRGSDPLDAGSTPEECDGLDNDGDTLVDDGWPDADGDGLADCLDPDMDTDGDGIANPDDPDDDNDGFSDEVEIFMGLSSLAACGPDAWAPDMNDDAEVDIMDVLRYKPVLNGAYERRYDLDTNGEVDIMDVLLYKCELGKTCTKP